MFSSRPYILINPGEKINPITPIGKIIWANLEKIALLG